MKSQRYEQGLAKLMEFNDPTSNGANHLAIIDSLKDIAPDVSEFIIAFGYGDLYTRPGLDNKQRTLITISSLVTQGMLPQLETHINAALVSGATPIEIVETLIHLLAYTGFPKVINAIGVAKKVFAQRGIKVDVDS